MKSTENLFAIDKKINNSYLSFHGLFVVFLVEQSSSVVASNKVIYFEKRQCGKRAYKAAGVQKNGIVEILSGD